MDLQWYYSIGYLEYAFVCLFFIAILLYYRRTYRLARQLNQSNKRIFIKFPIRCIYFSLLLIALLGPSFGFGKKYVNAIGKDIFLLIDLSKSMDAEDISPSRIEKIKYELKDFLNTFRTDRIGLIIFSSEAFLQCPLTYDKDALEIFIQTLHTGLLPGGSTDFYPPLKMALERFDLEENTNSKNFNSKLVILISDGEDFGSNTENILSEYQNMGIRLFTLGIGTLHGAKIPIGGGAYKLDKTGEIVLTKMNYKKLESMALLTGGTFFELGKNINEMPRLVQNLQEIKGQKLDMRAVDVSYNKYEYFIWAALSLICLDILLIVKVIKL